MGVVRRMFYLSVSSSFSSGLRKGFWVSPTQNGNFAQRAQLLRSQAVLSHVGSGQLAFRALPGLP